MYSLIPKFEPGSKEEQMLIHRIKQGCVNQSKQIDKTKIGQAVKCIPKVWNTFQKGSEEDTDEDIEQKNFYNRILADQKPYFFKYKYPELKKEINKYTKDREEICITYFGKTISQLKEMYEDGEYLTDEEIKFIETYDKYYPAIDTDCIMNKVCHYIESIDFNIKQHIRSNIEFDYKTLLSDGFTESSINKKIYNKIEEEISSTFKFWQDKSKNKKNNKLNISFDDDMIQEKFNREAECAALKLRLDEITSNEEQLANHLIYLFYVEHPSYSKSTLWQIAGKQIFENIKSKNKEYYFPIKDENGSIEFLYDNYQIKKLRIKEELEKNIEKNRIKCEKGLDKYSEMWYNTGEIWE